MANKDAGYKPRGIMLKAIPESAYRVLVMEQARLRLEKKRMVSLETTVYILLGRMATPAE